MNILNNEPVQEYQLNVIGEKTEIQGSFTIEAITRFHGKCVGEIHAKPGSTLILMESAMVEGKIFGDQVIIDGYVHGEVHATGKITISRQGRVTGKVQAPKIEVENGAWVEGSFISNPKPLAISIS